LQVLELASLGELEPLKYKDSNLGLIILLKETERVMSTDPPCKDDNARFTTVPEKAFTDQV